ncbi:hypothetical protein OOZ15_17520 [Galbibacter sp. EGI 63066]|uniref:family 16 glycoside hydrolase n=1 Tax=Galbibacter sp. EGI 63066 TaxID=2993559 RepID=UPI00224977B9|nr:family 16 glycoside hydrolase [Galbibacter sp. EGI 63066]MCX2681757.1 hypothetical protein [Galbibacter sp. EGI 63066]
MMNTENEYIALCKNLLEEKFSFGNGQGYTQKDLEQLSLYIEEHTGCYISLSTLKRIWKNKYKTQPQLATLNALVNVLGYKNWQDFKIQHKNNFPKKTLRLPMKKKYIFIVGVTVLILGSITLFSFGNDQNNKVKINGPIKFSTNKTLAKGVPNTFIFNYDLHHVKADSFFIQQSWNGWRKEKIDPNKAVYASTYYESGYHRAKLIANNQIIATQAVHIISDGWEPHIYYSEADDRYINFNSESFIENGILHLPKRLLLKKKVDISKHFMSRITHSDNYHVTSDTFTFKTKIKLDHEIESNCPWLAVLLITTENIFKVGLVGKGCETGANYKLGEIYKEGKNNNLSKLGTDLYQWNDIEIKVKNKNATIFLNGKETYSEHYQEDMGDIMGIAYIFEGTGSIDYVQLLNDKNQIGFEDNFDAL